MPHLKALSDEYSEDLVIIGVHSTKGSGEMKDFVAENEISYPVAVDRFSKTFKAFKGNSYPDYFMIDRNGVLRFADLVNSELEAAIEFLVAEPASDESEE